MYNDTKSHSASKMSYSQEILNELLSFNGATLTEQPPKLNKTCDLLFRCRCGAEDSKKFVNAKNSGLFCKACTETERRTKREKTNLEKYGNTCSLQSETISKKAKETLINKFGTDNVFKNADESQRNFKGKLWC